MSRHTLAENERARSRKIGGAEIRGTEAYPGCERSLSGAELWFAQAREAFAVNRFEEALRKFDDAVLSGADPDRCTFERWNCLMKLGRYELAWQETDRTEAQRRARRESQQSIPLHERRVWDGTDLRKRRVLVRCYHGLGDTIQFARYLPLLRAEARDVLVQSQNELQPLLESIRDLATFIRAGEEVRREQFDVEVEIMELAYIFRTQVESIPSRVPYLHISEEKRKSRRKELKDLGLDSSYMNVGLVWSSGDWNPARNIELSRLKSISAVAGIKLFSLQRGAAAQQMEWCSEFRITQTEHESGTLLDTAATIENMDLVICVDTMVAHLAGALGKRVWTLLPFCADWRWMADGEHSPWYPTMRLFRQQRRGEWSSVVEQLEAELRKVAKTGNQATCGCSRDSTCSPKTNDSIAATESGTGNSMAR